MRKFLALSLMIACGAAALAQTTAPSKTITPTTVTGADALAKGEDTASVNQVVTLTLPKATALHLDVTQLDFDLRALNGTNWGPGGPNEGSDFGGKMVCVYGTQNEDATLQLDNNFYNQVQTLPLGTYYQLNWPNVTVVGGDVVTSYPPIQTNANGELVPGSKNHFVCYRTFIIQKFSNAPYFKLTATRDDLTDQSIEHLYIQDNPCYSGEVAPPTGLYDLPDGSTRELIPRNLQSGPTGDRSAANAERCGYKSWLDDLVVMAVKVNSDLAGVSTANVTYTLTSFGWDD